MEAMFIALAHIFESLGNITSRKINRRHNSKCIKGLTIGKGGFRVVADSSPTF